MEKIIRRNRHSHASQARIEELKKLVKSDNYVNSSINALADRMSKSVKIDMYKNKSICSGVNCDTCIDRKECNKMIKGRKIDFYV
jgi:uncharacterized membrane-anchored protein YjiN (DUF445 family)